MLNLSPILIRYYRTICSVTNILYHNRLSESMGGIMKTEKTIATAFVLNLSFAALEFIGGIVTGSVAIVSDAFHDVGDAASIGISYFLEKKSRKRPDDQYTYGYARYSVLGGCITALILLIGSVVMIYNAFSRMLAPTEINYNGMIGFAVVGVCVNSCAVFFTRERDSLNQKAVNLHMLEDILGWATVLVGAVVMRFTDLTFIDPILSIGVSLFIAINAVRNLKEAIDLFLEKAPHTVDTSKIKELVEKISGVFDVHHIHLWSVDGRTNLATLHVVTNSDPYTIKNEIRAAPQKHGIEHVTIEIETSTEQCRETHCHAELLPRSGHNHHHGHHSHDTV